MFRGSVELLQAHQPTLVEDLGSILVRVMDIEIVGLDPATIVDAMVNRTIGYLSEPDDLPLLV